MVPKSEKQEREGLGNLTQLETKFLKSLDKNFY